MVLTELQLVLDRWKEYCAELYETGENVHPQIPWEQTEEEPDILPGEVEKAIKALKSGKSPGRDGIPAELIKNLGPKGIEIIAALCNSIWKTGRWPRDWTESVFVPLHKKGSTTACGNYRTISLISHASKVLLHIVNQRLNT